MKQIAEDVLIAETYQLVSEKYVSTPLNSGELIELFKKEAENQQFEVDVFGKQDNYDMIGLSKEVDSSLPYVYISAGIHGNEPAPPLAVLKLLKAGAFTDDYNWVICPVMNPYGLSKATRRNSEGIDMNRQYKDSTSPEIDMHIRWLERYTHFDLTMSCHEDHEAVGFYLYEKHSNDKPSIAQDVIKAVAPILPIDMDYSIDGEHAVKGVIRSEKSPEKRKHWPEMIYMAHNYTEGRHYTFETPSQFNIKSRVNAMATAIATAVSKI